MKILKNVDSFDNIYNIDIEYLKRNHIGAVIADADNTLLPWKSDELSAETLAWIAGLKSNNIELCILSNGKKPRISSLAKMIGADFIADGLKPLPFGYIKACKLLGKPKEQCLFAGDQMFTDILGARLAGIKAVIVHPVSRHEFLWTRFVRNIEKMAGRKFKW